MFVAGYVFIMLSVVLAPLSVWWKIHVDEIWCDLMAAGSWLSLIMGVTLIWKSLS